jgi:hypothetical protein
MPKKKHAPATIVEQVRPRGIKRARVTGGAGRDVARDPDEEGCFEVTMPVTFDLDDPSHSFPVPPRSVMGENQHTVFPRDHRLLRIRTVEFMETITTYLTISRQPESYMRIAATADAARQALKVSDVYLDAFLGVSAAYSAQGVSGLEMEVYGEGHMDLLWSIAESQRNPLECGPFPRLTPTPGNFVAVTYASLALTTAMIIFCLPGFEREWLKENPDLYRGSLQHPDEAVWVFGKYRRETIYGLLTHMYYMLLEDLRNRVRRNRVDICKYVPVFWPGVTCYLVGEAERALLFSPVIPTTTPPPPTPLCYDSDDEYEVPAAREEVDLRGNDWLLTRRWNEHDTLLKFDLNAPWPWTVLFKPDHILIKGGMCYLWKSQVRDALLVLLAEEGSLLYDRMFQFNWAAAKTLLLPTLLCPRHMEDMEEDMPSPAYRLVQGILLTYKGCPKLLQEIREQFAPTRMLHEERRISGPELVRRMQVGITFALKKRGMLPPGGVQFREPEPSKPDDRRPWYKGIKIGVKNVTGCLAKGCKGHPADPNNMFFLASYGPVGKPTYITVKSIRSMTHPSLGANSRCLTLGTICVPANLLTEECKWKYAGDFEWAG